MPLFSKDDPAELVALALLAEGPAYGYRLTKEAAGSPS